MPSNSPTPAAMPTARYSACAAALNDEIVVMGGAQGNAALRVVEAYKPATNAWRRLADPAGSGLPALPLRLILRQGILGGERQGDPVKGFDDIRIQRTQFFTVGDGAGELRLPVDKQNADFFAHLSGKFGCQMQH